MLALLLGCGGDGRDPVTSTFPTDTAGPRTFGALAFDRPPPRNVWMVSIDTLRRDHVDLHATDGVARLSFLSERMAEGVVLGDHQQCANWTLHSVTCTLLGRPLEDVGWIPRLDDGTPAPDGLRTLAVRLREVGYEPIVASANPWFGPEWNSIQGYGGDVSDAERALDVGHDGLRALRAAIERRPNAPWLLHTHFMEPHTEYDPPEAYLDEVHALPPVPWDLTTFEGMAAMNDAWPRLDPEDQALVQRHLEALYTAELRYLDDQVWQLWVEMEEEGLLDDALVVVWSDHGEAMFDHGQWRHGRFLHGEENAGVLAFWAKGLGPVAWDGPTHAVDLVPTVLAVLGVDPGEDLPGAIAGTAAPDRARFASASGKAGPTAAVTRDGDKLVYRFVGRLERYDLDVDPLERTDLYSAEDPVSEALWDLLAPRVRTLDALVPESAALPPAE